jgi:hypothetical protein
MEFGEHHVDTHVRGKDLMVVYTDDPVKVEKSIDTMEQLLASAKYKVVSFALQFTQGRTGYDQKVAVVQLCVGDQVLLYHYCLAARPCACLHRFDNSTQYSFATVDTANYRQVLGTTGLAYQNLVDIQGQYRMGSEKAKFSLVELAMAIIGPYYSNTRDACKRAGLAWHKAWVRKLDEDHFMLAAKMVYTCYDMYRRIIDMKSYLIQVGKGSSQKQSSGKCHKN